MTTPNPDSINLYPSKPEPFAGRGSISLLAASFFFPLSCCSPAEFVVHRRASETRDMLDRVRMGSINSQPNSDAQMMVTRYVVLVFMFPLCARRI